MPATSSGLWTADGLGPQVCWTVGLYLSGRSRTNIGVLAHLEPVAASSVCEACCWYWKLAVGTGRGSGGVERLEGGRV
jgi:hypothetical protein